jgi:predicted DNA-binding protein (UPF0251 family)
VAVSLEPHTTGYHGDAVSVKMMEVVEIQGFEVEAIKLSK